MQNSLVHRIGYVKYNIRNKILILIHSRESILNVMEDDP
jgi:hypothetical protein